MRNICRKLDKEALEYNYWLFKCDEGEIQIMEVDAPRGT